jgi:ABC-2 type transport system ATP-binding protein
MIKLVHVTKRFGSFTAVEDLSIEVKRGEFYGFLGPNGAGKTTTIKMMTGLFTPTAGEIQINGYDIIKQPLEAKLNTGYIPDQPFLYEKLTGREFLFFSGGLYKIPHVQLTKRIDEVIAQMEIGSWLDRRTEDYSQGMRQRIVIVSALLHNPAVLIIDEPMVGLDPRSAHIVKEVFKQKSKEGVSILMSTHSLSVAEELCDRIGIIKDGRLIFEDTVESLKQHRKPLDGKLESIFLELTK